MDTQLPDVIESGTTVEYTRDLSSLGYSASDAWSMTLYIAGGVILNKVAGVSGSSFTIALTPTETGTLPEGDYEFRERVTKAGKTYTATSGRVRVTANIATAAAGDMQSFDEKALSALNAMIVASKTGGGWQGRLADDVAELEIAGRRVVNESLREIHRLRDYYAARVRARRKKGKVSDDIRGRFTGSTRP